MGVRFPWEEPALAETVPVPRADLPPKPRGRRPHTRPASAAPAAAAGQHRPSWLYHHLTVTGPADTLKAFTAAARGAGITPWATDSAAVEDEVFTRAASQPPALRRLTIEGCRTLARQVRDRFEAHHARAAERVGRSHTCPLDLHTLLPVPDAILRLQAADPAAQAWLAANWGTDRLLQVTARPDIGPGRRLPQGDAVAGYGFFTRGDTPHAAAGQLAALWPGLHFVLRPRPA